jgi:hypothetical protein
MIATLMLVLALLVLASGVALAHGDTSVGVQPLTPKPDEVITVTVKGEALGEDTEVEVRVMGQGEDVDLGEVQTDAEGDFTAEFRLPADLKPGTYQLKAIGEESAEIQLTVKEGPAGSAAQEQPSEPAAEEEAAAGEQAAMEQQAPILRQRPLGQSIGLVALFGALAAVGMLFAMMRRGSAQA